MPEVTDALQQEGCLVELRVSKWSGRAPLEPDDLGLPPGVVDDRLHHLGRRQLVPKERLDVLAKLEARARTRVANSSYEFPIGGGRFVPAAALGALLADLAKIRADFEAAVSDFCANFDASTSVTRAELIACAERTALELGKDAAWKERFETRLAQAYPVVESVRAAFSMQWNLYQLTVPSGLQARAVTAAQALEAGRIAEEARERVEAQLSAFVGEAAVELRRRAGELCRHVARQVGQGGRLSERTIQPLRDLIAEFRAIDFTGDGEFAEQLERLQADWLGANRDAGTAERAREDADYRQQLGNALTTVADRALAESEQAAAEALQRFLARGPGGRAVS